jgi:hypothetical protein
LCPITASNTRLLSFKNFTLKKQKIKKTLFVVLAGICVFASCKKSDGKSTSDKMIGKWQFVSDIEHASYNGVDYRDSTLGVTGNTMEFRNDGKAYLDLGTYNRDSGSYKVIDDSHFVLDDGTGPDTLMIQTLTGNSFIMYNKTLESFGYTEYTVTLKK